MSEDPQQRDEDADEFSEIEIEVQSADEPHARRIGGVRAPILPRLQDFAKKRKAQNLAIPANPRRPTEPDLNWIATQVGTLAQNLREDRTGTLTPIIAKLVKAVGLGGPTEPRPRRTHRSVPQALQNYKEVLIAHGAPVPASHMDRGKADIRRIERELDFKVIVRRRPQGAVLAAAVSPSGAAAFPGGS